MANRHRFSESILSTPDPIHCSSMIADKTGKKKFSLSTIDDLPERDRRRDSSLGLLSINSDYLTEKLLETEKEKARESMRSFDQKRDFKGLPSYYVKPSDTKDSSYYEKYVHSESTVSESDLLPTNTSTPRESLLNSGEVIRQARVSMGKTIASIGSSFRNDKNYSLKQLKGDFHQTMSRLSLDAVFSNGDSISLENVSFQSGDAALEKLQKDELSFQRQNIIPEAMKEFSSVRDSATSIGSFFIQRSDDLPNMLAPSPEKKCSPIPLICDSPPKNEATSRTHTLLDTQNVNSPLGKTTVCLEDIQGILASEVSTGNALEELWNLKKNPQKYKKIPQVSTAHKQEVKENISPDPEKSIYSTRSASSLSSLPNGKLPIASNKTELLWGCIKPGKTSSQELVLKNRSGNRLVLQCTLTKPLFRISKDGTELSTLKLALHPYESRALTLTFSPTSVGAAVDNLTFTPVDPNHKQTVNQFIKLFGYGGYGNVTFSNLVKDTTGKFLLPLGNIDQDLHHKQSFILKNHGTLPSFAYIYFAMDSLPLSSSVEISPKAVVLKPNEEKEVVVRYHLQKNDFNFIKLKVNNCVIDVGKLQVIHGTEVNRARLRKVCQKAKHKNHSVTGLALDLINDFLEETPITDLKFFNECTSSLEDIMKLLNRDDITVTLEQDVDVTMINNIQDETELFHSLCEQTVVEVEAAFKDTCVVEPTRIILTPPEKIKDLIFFTNNGTKSLHFEVNVAPEGLLVKPKDGVVVPGQTALIEVHFTKHCNDKTVFKVKIYVDNDCFEVDVKVIFCKR